MAGVEVTISGVIWDKQLKAGRPVTIIGEAILTGLGVGGGPIMPPEGGGGSGPVDPGYGKPMPPDMIWGGRPGPGPGGGWVPKPPGIWGGPIDPYPGHPLPEPPGKPEEPIQPPIDWKVVWHPTEGWLVVGIPNVLHPTPSGK